MSERSQCEAIARHLQSGKALTALDALRLYNTFRLSGRIYELKKRGMKIDKIMVKRGEKTFARYYQAA